MVGVGRAHALQVHFSVGACVLFVSAHIVVHVLHVGVENILQVLHIIEILLLQFIALFSFLAFLLALLALFTFALLALFALFALLCLLCLFAQTFFLIQLLESFFFFFPCSERLELFLLKLIDFFDCALLSGGCLLLREQQCGQLVAQLHVSNLFARLHELQLLFDVDRRVGHRHRRVGLPVILGERYIFSLAFDEFFLREFGLLVFLKSKFVLQPEGFFALSEKRCVVNIVREAFGLHQCIDHDTIHA